MASNIYHMMAHFHHCTPGGVAGSAVPDIISLDAVFFHCKEQADKVGSGKGFWGGGGGLYGRVSMKNWIYRSKKGFSSVLVIPLQYYPGHRRKNNRIQVRS